MTEYNRVDFDDAICGVSTRTIRDSMDDVGTSSQLVRYSYDVDDSSVGRVIKYSSEGCTNTNNLLENVEYTDKVKKQMQLGDYHSFPDAVDAFGADGKVTSIIGGDGITRTKIEIPGSYMGKDGVFQYIIESDGVTCNHHLFVPNHY